MTYLWYTMCIWSDPCRVLCFNSETSQTHNQTHIITNIMKQSREHNGHLNPKQKNKQKKNISKMMIGPTIDTDSQMPTFWNRLRKEPSFSFLALSVQIIKSYLPISSDVLIIKYNPNLVCEWPCQRQSILPWENWSSLRSFAVCFVSLCLSDSLRYVSRDIVQLLLPLLSEQKKLKMI